MPDFVPAYKEVADEGLQDCSIYGNVSECQFDDRQQVIQEKAPHQYRSARDIRLEHKIPNYDDIVPSDSGKICSRHYKIILTLIKAYVLRHKFLAASFLRTVNHLMMEEPIYEGLNCANVGFVLFMVLYAANK